MTPKDIQRLAIACDTAVWNDKGKPAELCGRIDRISDILAAAIDPLTAEIEGLRELFAGPVDPPLWALKEAQKIVATAEIHRTLTDIHPDKIADRVVGTAHYLVRLTSGGTDG